MNEKIKLVVKNNKNLLLFYYYDESCTIYTEKKLVFTEEDVKQKCNDAYLQGAKDLWEAVKMDYYPIEDKKPLHSEGYTKNLVITAVNIKAQQFIDSLEKGENNE